MYLILASALRVQETDKRQPYLKFSLKLEQILVF